MELHIENCNSIDKGEVKIQEGRLNIIYALNGTGKSTIVHALEKNILGTIDDLRPFKYIGDNITAHNPKLSLDGTVRKIAVFNESYVNSYVFQKDELLKNSFEILIKTEEYDKFMNEINQLVAAITETFKADPEIEKLIEDLTKFEESFGNAKNGYSKTGDIGKSLSEGNKLQEIPIELKAYEPFLKSEDKCVDWIKWQAKGNEYIEIAEECPYCVSKITTPKETILKVSKNYDAKYLTALSKVLEVFTALKHYFDDATQNTIRSIVLSRDGISKDQIEFLKSVKDETNRLKETLIALKYIGFSTFSYVGKGEVDKVISELNKRKIDLYYFPKLKSLYTENKIAVINNSIQSVIDKAGKLFGQIIQQKKFIADTIENYKSEINGFLLSAGYMYSVDIIKTSNESYKLVLKYATDSSDTINVNEHLSYGERNAFALVLFMYQAIKEDADLIVLDDPISSFDTNKKYAILKMLFMGKVSLQERTVLMLTHDFEPVFASIYNMKSYFQPATVATFLSNVNGNLDEKEINKEDIKSFLEICNCNIEESTNILHKLIYLRRYLEITNSKNSAWQMTSNVFHKDREKPLLQRDGEASRFMTEEEIIEAEQEIQKHIEGFSYNEVYAIVKDRTQLIKIYDECKSGYEKVQIYRLIFDGEQEKGSPLKKYVDQTFHVQNDYLFQLNPREYKIVPQYILEFCDEAIDNIKTYTCAL